MGPWLVYGAVAARALGVTNIHMLGVEADYEHYLTMLRHLKDNGFEPEDHKIYCAAVGAVAGKAHFPVTSDSFNEWGTRPGILEEGKMRQADGSYLGSMAALEQVEVDVFGINDLLAQRDFWDLIHIDIQGCEAEVCLAGMAQFSEKVHYVIVGTHSRLLDGAVLELFHKAGWFLENEKPTQFTYRQGVEPLESMTWVDGTQVWRNPKF